MVNNPWWFESVEILKTRNRWLLFLGSLKKKSELEKPPVPVTYFQNSKNLWFL
jgi:hypothetical protein